MTKFPVVTASQRESSTLPMQRQSAPLVTMLLALLLNACSVNPPIIKSDTGVERWQQHSTGVSAIDTWDLNGRIAIQKQKESASASLKWHQSQSSFTIRIFGPFGKGAVELSGDESKVSMLDAEGLTLEAENAETLLQDYLGWQVPVSGLYYWIRGIPNPGEYVQSMVLDTHSRLLELRQSGWQIHYKRYQAVNELQLPARLELLNHDLKVKLVLRDWEPKP